MQSALRGQSPTLLIVGVVAALLVADSNCFPTQLSVQQIIDKDLGTSEATLSMIVNQMAVLKLLNQSSTICSLHERELQERMNRSIDLEVKAEQVKNELNATTQQVKNEMEEVKEATLLQMNSGMQETKEALLEMKNEIQETKEAALLQMNSEIQATKEAAILELKNMTMETMKEAKSLLDGAKETVVNTSRQVAIMLTQDCEIGWTKYQFSCYKVFNTNVNHADATARCRALGARLATIGSEGENSFVGGLISGYTYIGLDDIAEQGVWAWQDGSPFSYSKWGSGEPSHATSHCVCTRTSSYWRDLPCESTIYYICEKLPQ